MARARAVETRLEKLLPAMEEYFTCGFLTRDQIIAIMQRRTEDEYRLIAKPLLYLDVTEAVAYELQLEEALAAYCKGNKLKNLKHRSAILERIEYIYTVGYKHLQKQDKRTLTHFRRRPYRDPAEGGVGDGVEGAEGRGEAQHEEEEQEEAERLRRAYITFLQQYHRGLTLSRFYAELLQLFPTRADIWCEAALYEATTKNKLDNARRLVQQTMMMNENEPVVWVTALEIELLYVAKLQRELAATRAAERQKAVTVKKNNTDHHDHKKEAAATAEDDAQHVKTVLAKEDERMKKALFDLSLPKLIIQEALKPLQRRANAEEPESEEEVNIQTTKLTQRSADLVSRLFHVLVHKGRMYGFVEPLLSFLFETALAARQTRGFYIAQYHQLRGSKQQHHHPSSNSDRSDSADPTQANEVLRRAIEWGITTTTTAERQQGQAPRRGPARTEVAVSLLSLYCQTPFIAAGGARGPTTEADGCYPVVDPDVFFNTLVHELLNEEAEESTKSTGKNKNEKRRGGDGENALAAAAAVPYHITLDSKTKTEVEAIHEKEQMIKRVCAAQAVLTHLLLLHALVANQQQRQEEEENSGLTAAQLYLPTHDLAHVVSLLTARVAPYLAALSHHAERGVSRLCALLLAQPSPLFVDAAAASPSTSAAASRKGKPTNTTTARAPVGEGKTLKAASMQREVLAMLLPREWLAAPEVLAALRSCSYFSLPTGTESPHSGSDNASNEKQSKKQKGSRKGKKDKEEETEETSGDAVDAIYQMCVTMCAQQLKDLAAVVTANHPLPPPPSPPVSTAGLDVPQVRWPLAVLTPLLIGEDKNVLLSLQQQQPPQQSSSSSGPTQDRRGAAVGDGASTSGHVQALLEHFLVWFHDMNHNNNNNDSNQNSGSTSATAAQDESQKVQREKVLDLLCALGLVDRARLVAGDLTTPFLFLLSKQSPLRFQSLEATPLSLWSVFSILETLFPDGRRCFTLKEAPSRRQEKAVDSSSSSSDGDESEEAQDLPPSSSYFDSFAEAGLAYLQSVPKALLLPATSTASTTLHAEEPTAHHLAENTEWSHCEGIFTLLRKRLLHFFAVLWREEEGADGESARRRRRRSTTKTGEEEDVLAWLRATPFLDRSSLLEALQPATALAPPQLQQKGELQAALRSLLALFEDTAKRSQPLPRAVTRYVLLPFYEAAVVLLGQAPPSSPLASLFAAATSPATARPTRPSAPIREQLVLRIRALYEQMISLYVQSRHRSIYVPLLYEPTSAKAATTTKEQQQQHHRRSREEVLRQNNAADWLLYVGFERQVSEDLRAAAGVADRATREALSPQYFLTQSQRQ